MKKFWDKVRNMWQTSAPPVSRQDEERIKFTEEVRKELLKLKEKGLAIPIFTL